MKFRAALAVVLLLGACAQLPDGSSSPLSPEVQLVAVCTSIAAVEAELARRIRAGDLSRRDIEAVAAVKPTVDRVCLGEITDPVQALAEARTALARLALVAERNRRETRE